MFCLFSGGGRNQCYSPIVFFPIFGSENPAGSLEAIQDRPPGLKFSGEIEHFKRATHLSLHFLWGILGIEISSKFESFNRD